MVGIEPKAGLSFNCRGLWDSVAATNALCVPLPPRGGDSVLIPLLLP
jgi:hypothetical protein